MNLLCLRKKNMSLSLFNANAFEKNKNNHLSISKQANAFNIDNELYYAMIKFLLNTDVFLINKNNQFELKQKSSNLSKQQEQIINDFTQQAKRVDIPNMDGKAFIIDFKGQKTLYVTGELSSTDMFQLQKGIGGLNIKPDMLLGEKIQTNQLLSVKDLINPNMQMLQKQKPNLGIHLLMATSLAIVASAFMLRDKVKKQKIKAFLQKRRMRHSMYNTYDDESDAHEYKKNGLNKYDDIGEIFLKLQKEHKFSQVQSYLNQYYPTLYKTIDWKDDTMKSIEDSYNINDAVANLLFNNKNDDSIKQFLSKFIAKQNDINYKHDIDLEL